MFTKLMFDFAAVMHSLSRQHVGFATREAGGYTTHDAQGSFDRAFHLLLSPAIVATIVAAEQTFATPVGEVAAGDIVKSVNKPTQQTIYCGGGRVAAVNSITIQFCNPTAAGVTPTASEEYRIVIGSDRAT